MSIEECKAATCAANPEAIASLLDGNGDLAKALLVPEKDTQALIDLARYQHQVLSEIAETIDSRGDTNKSADDKLTIVSPSLFGFCFISNVDDVPTDAPAEL
jgi:hypothetical protein